MALSTFAVRAELWELDPDEKPSLPGVAAMSALDPADGTPRFYSSGNGIEGGIFHAWFQIDLTQD
jgi:hypothetical protein